jgi:hypothetical protein
VTRHARLHPEDGLELGGGYLAVARTHQHDVASVLAQEEERLGNLSDANAESVGGKLRRRRAARLEFDRLKAVSGQGAGDLLGDHLLTA